MNAARKIIALLIIAFFGIPILIGVIWTVGLTKASVSPEFLVDLPQQIITDIPDLVEEIFEEGQNSAVIGDENIRTWFQAAARTGISPRDVMAESGMLRWLDYELPDSLEEVGDILRGRRRARPVSLDLIPLKQALSHEAIERYFLEVIDNLPPCESEDLAEWLEADRGDIDLFDLPPCRVDPAVARSLLRAERQQILEDIPDEVDVFEDVRLPTMGISRLVTLLSYAMFIFPLAILLVGALIAATSPGGFFRWLGIALLIGGLIAWSLAFFSHHLASAALDWAYMYSSDTDLTDLGRLVLEKTGWIQDLVLDRLFDPVQTLGGIVGIIGLVVFAVSFVASGRPKS